MARMRMGQRVREGGCDWAGVLGLARGVVKSQSGFCVVGLSPARSSKWNLRRWTWWRVRPGAGGACPRPIPDHAYLLIHAPVWLCTKFTQLYLSFHGRPPQRRRLVVSVRVFSCCMLWLLCVVFMWLPLDNALGINTQSQRGSTTGLARRLSCTSGCTMSSFQTMIIVVIVVLVRSP